MSDTDGQHKRKLRNYLLMSGLQLRYAGFVVVVSAILTAGLGSFVVSKSREASRIVDVRSLNERDNVAYELAQTFAKTDRALLVGLVVFGIVLIMTLLAYGIVMTHRIAGPLFKIARYIDDLGEGRFPTLGNLRRGDQLTEVYERFRRANDLMRKRAEDDSALLDRAAAAVSDAALRADLQRAVDEKRKALAD